MNQLVQISLDQIVSIDQIVGLYKNALGEHVVDVGSWAEFISPRMLADRNPSPRQQ